MPCSKTNDESQLSSFPIIIIMTHDHPHQIYPRPSHIFAHEGGHVLLLGSTKKACHAFSVRPKQQLTLAIIVMTNDKLPGVTQCDTTGQPMLALPKDSSNSAAAKVTA